MSFTVGGDGLDEWNRVIRRASGDTILRHVHVHWGFFSFHQAFSGVNLQGWSEPELTQGLAAHLSSVAEAGEQPFDGEFIAERSRYELDKMTRKPVCFARTDIEWTLYGFPGFTIEFKIIDGTSPRRSRYHNGMIKFLDGRYGGKSTTGAMWGLQRNGANSDPVAIRSLLTKRAGKLACTNLTAPITIPSVICASVASFDTNHKRSGGGLLPIALAHVFTPIP